jgi:hypothetical protein
MSPKEPPPIFLERRYFFPTRSSILSCTVYFLVWQPESCPTCVKTGYYCKASTNARGARGHAARAQRAQFPNPANKLSRKELIVFSLQPGTCRVNANSLQRALGKKTTEPTQISPAEKRPQHNLATRYECWIRALVLVHGLDQPTVHWPRLASRKHPALDRNHKKMGAYRTRPRTHRAAPARCATNCRLFADHACKAALAGSHAIALRSCNPAEWRVGENEKAAAHRACAEKTAET